MALITQLVSSCTGTLSQITAGACNAHVESHYDIDPNDTRWKTQETIDNYYWNRDSRPRQTKVSIPNFDTESASLRSGVDRLLYENLTALVSGSGASIVGGSDAQAVQEEIIAARREHRRIPPHLRAMSIDYALTRTISDPIYSAELGTIGTLDMLAFAKSGIQGKKGDPICRYKASIRGTLRLYRIASGEVVREWAMEGNEYNSIPKTSVTDCLEQTEKTAELVGHSVNSALEKVRNELPLWFRPVGKILEHKKDEEGRSIFKTSLGSSTGIRQAGSVSITQKQQFSDPLTNTPIIEEVTLVRNAEILRDQVDERNSWVYISDKTKAAAVQIGDTIEMNGTCEGITAINTLPIPNSKPKPNPNPNPNPEPNPERTKIENTQVIGVRDDA